MAAEAKPSAGAEGRATGFFCSTRRAFGRSRTARSLDIRLVAQAAAPRGLPPPWRRTRQPPRRAVAAARCASVRAPAPPRPAPRSGTYFTDKESLAEHYRSDFHRYNLKRKVAGLPPVTKVRGLRAG